MRGTVYFRRDRELWSSDGTDAGTNVVTDMAVASLTASDEHLYFLADVGSGQTGLWMSDGTTDGTHVSLVDSIDVVNEELRRIDESNEGSRSFVNDPNSDSSDSWVMASNGEKTLYWSTNEQSMGLWGIKAGDETPTLLSGTIFGPSAGIVGPFDSLTVVEFEGKALIEAVGAGLPRRLWQSDGINTIPMDPALASPDNSSVNDFPWPPGMTDYHTRSRVQPQRTAVFRVSARRR